MNMPQLSTDSAADSAATPQAQPDSGSALFRGALGSVIMQAGGIGVAFASQVGLAHLLGAGDFGQYVYVVAWVNLLCVFGRVGLDLASLRFIAEYCSRHEGGLLRGFVKQSVLWAMVVSGSIAILGMAASWFLAGAVEAGVLRAATLGLALIPILSLQGLFISQLRALKRVILCQLPRQIVSPLAVVTVTFLVVAVTGRAAQATTALTLSVVINATLTVLVGVVSLRHLRPNFAPATTETRLWFSCSLSLLFVAVVQMINLRVDVLMVGAMLGMKEAGIYTAASQLAGLCTLGLVGVNIIAAPMIAELHAKGRRDEFQRFLTQASWIIALVTLPLAVVLLCAGPWLLGLFGSEFARGYPALNALVIGHALGALAGPIGFLVIMTGNQREGAWILGTAAALNVVMNLVLIPRFGLLGGATATAITTVVWNAAMLAFVGYKLRVNPTIASFSFSRFTRLPTSRLPAPSLPAPTVPQAPEVASR